MRRGEGGGAYVLLPDVVPCAVAGPVGLLEEVGLHWRLVDCDGKGTGWGVSIRISSSLGIRTRDQGSR